MCNVSALLSDELKEKVNNVKSKISTSLKDVHTNFVKSNNKKGLVTVAFPDATSRDKGSLVTNN